jgi:hypothetical protein
MESDCIFAWNWRTGERLCVGPFSNHISAMPLPLLMPFDPSPEPTRQKYFYERPSVLVSFCLLTPMSFLLTGFDLRSSTPLVTLYAFAPLFGPALETLPIKPWPVRQYELPRLQSDCFHTSVVCLDVRSETAVSSGPKLYGRPKGSDERLFTADPRRGMVVVDLEAGRRLFHVRRRLPSPRFCPACADLPFVHPHPRLTFSARH